ncbi:MAG: hypothetical protein LQ350_005236 [Teloschistes chrysophthalmus]|nr:MAG: hypothetical protein LQ350_005236 [Niorma chrysophthalma]
MGGAAPISGDEAEHGREHGSGEGGKMVGGDDTVQKEGEGMMVGGEDTVEEKGEAKMVGEKDTAHQNDKASSTKVRGEDKVQKDVEAKLREVYGDNVPPFFRIKGHRYDVRSAD